MKKQNKNDGFSLIELIVVIAIMAVLMAVLAPSLIRYVEDSRMQKDDSAMSEVVQGTKLAFSNAEIYDEMLDYAALGNYTHYSDSSGVVGKRETDSEVWVPSGSGRTVTITFYPDENQDFDLAAGRINQMPNSGNTTLKTGLLGNTKLYGKLSSTVSKTINNTSATYRNSDYTVFIDFTDKAVDIYGEWNGTNIDDSSQVAPPPAPPKNDDNAGDGNNKPSTGGNTTPTTPPGGNDGGGSSGGGTSKPTHTHSYSKEIVKAATCTEAGQSREVCSCGSTRNTQTIPALGHDLTDATCTAAPKCKKCGATVGNPLGHNYGAATTTTQATCEAAGTAVKVCSRCNDRQTITIPASGHDYKTTTTNATCTVAGTTVKTCSRCGDKQTTTGKPLGHDWIAATCSAPKTCRRCNATEGSILPHTYTTTANTATCTAGGTMTQVCSRCGNTTTTSSPALGHDYKITANVDATCTSTGNVINTCSRCGNREVTQTPALGHIYSTQSTATCTADGTLTKTCALCGDSTVTPLKALGHDLTITRKEPTYEENGYEHSVCSRGDYDRTLPIQKLSHIINYPDDDIPNEGYAIFANKTNGQPDVKLTWEELKQTANGTKFGYTAANISDTSIKAQAFLNNKYLKEICFPITMLQVGNGVVNNTKSTFGGAAKLEKIILNDGLESIGSYAFSSMANVPKMAVPKTTEVIGNYAFFNSAVTEITLYQGIIDIGQYAFSKTNIISMEIPESVQTLGNRTLESCTRLDTLEIWDGDTTLDSVPEYMCNGCTMLRKITLPDRVSLIKKYAFNGCANIYSLTIPGNISAIETYAFSDCTGIQRLTLSEGVSEIGTYCFNNCQSLLSVSLPSTLKRIPSFAFGYAKSLQEIVLPEGLEYIDTDAFSFSKGESNMGVFRKITIPSTIKEIQASAFKNVRWKPVKNGLLFVFNGDMETWNSACSKNGKNTGILKCYDGQTTEHDNETGVNHHYDKFTYTFNIQLADGALHETNGIVNNTTLVAQ